MGEVRIEAGRFHYDPAQRRDARRHARAARKQGFLVSLKRKRRSETDDLCLVIWGERAGALWHLPEWDARFDPPRLLGDSDDSRAVIGRFQRSGQRR